MEPSELIKKIIPASERERENIIEAEFAEERLSELIPKISSNISLIGYSVDVLLVEEGNVCASLLLMDNSEQEYIVNLTITDDGIQCELE